MGMCGPAQALKAKWPGGEVGVIISSRLCWAPIQRSGCRRTCEAAETSPPPPLPPHLYRTFLAGGFCCCFKPRPGPDGVGWGGMRPDEASWTVAQCGDCLSAQALGHAATPPWARAPALGFQRDVTGGLAFPLHCRIHAPPTVLPKTPSQTAFSPHSLPAPKCPSNSFSVSAMNPGSFSHCAIPTTAASHLGREGGEKPRPSEKDMSQIQCHRVCAATSSFSNWPIISFSLHRSPHGISLAGPPVKFLPSWSQHSRSQPPCLGRA
ncbi:hypothetical protein Q8A73_017418 [Channa argus]|nr:hypothetical protein Q8A73_017418 [Channa argus]